LPLPILSWCEVKCKENPKSALETSKTTDDGAKKEIEITNSKRLLFVSESLKARKSVEYFNIYLVLTAG
jgi:hypothetical protein